MDGAMQDGWYTHPSLDLIKIFSSGTGWVYQCYSQNGQKALSKERTLDGWTWALSQPANRNDLD